MGRIRNFMIFGKAIFYIKMSPNFIKKNPFIVKIIKTFQELFKSYITIKPMLSKAMAFPLLKRLICISLVPNVFKLLIEDCFNNIERI